ncbi:MAG: hypothetical protein HC799_01460 [Limnothrix sp. RL_2_0]|nr:hypothetical protein [Limnothrix sp. RL_2_0]
MNSDMDNNKMSSQNAADQLPLTEHDPGLSGEQTQLWEDNYPDQALETEMDPILVEDFLLELSPDAIIDEELSTNMNNMNAIEARFQSLLKDRLLQEIASHPPRFPWETGSEVYLTDGQPEQEPVVTPLWQPQLAAFNIPFKMPEPMLSNLMRSCSEAMQSLEPQGAKLVQAVQELFPVEQLMLHQMAQWVMATPDRSGPAAVLTGDFQTASDQQQIAMSMIAAKTILEQLTINVSAKAPAKFEWETAVGAIAIKASHVSNQTSELGHKVHLSVYLPQGGQVTWETAQGSASASRLYPGELGLTLVDCQKGGIYPVTITFNQANQEPLTVAIALDPA